MISSKLELLQSIMRSYSAMVTEGWERVLTSDATPIEKLDALMWFNINVLDRCNEEYRIQVASLPQSPPRSPNLAMSFPAQLRKIRTLLSDGLRTGELQIEKSSADLRARSVFALIWTPENIVHDEGTSAAHSLAREIVLRGAARRS